jgi:Cu-processing system permease protein
LDISALLGYTGALFRQFFGTGTGFLISMGMLVLWTLLPLWRLVYISKKKDF